MFHQQYTLILKSVVLGVAFHAKLTYQKFQEQHWWTVSAFQTDLCEHSHLNRTTKKKRSLPLPLLFFCVVTVYGFTHHANLYVHMLWKLQQHLHYSLFFLKKATAICQEQIGNLFTCIKASWNADLSELGNRAPILTLLEMQRPIGWRWWQTAKPHPSQSCLGSSLSPD